MTRFISLSVMCLSAAMVQGFAPASIRPRQKIAFHDSVRSPSVLLAEVEEAATEGIKLIVEGKNIEVTDALYEYVDKRIGNTLGKLSGDGNVRDCDVILSVSKNPKVKANHRVEVVTNLKGTTIVCTFESPDMYSSIDSVTNALNRKLRKYKERRLAGWHGGASMGDDLSAALDALEEDMIVEMAEEELEEEFVDPEKPIVTKTNSFQLDKPITLEEAIFALDYVDHDFYVFTNEKTGKVSTVYKRHGGGVGLIEP
eukprot:CAMPEP_0198136558 /NCGR_PEP_ID=MMETSP1443-20131203/202_1 /TAXON_ID=186043 /ORGANISM="Entomoneis sp., Strain CCMP2396" /LENGTH=255 /DNA_ID=CAMNT_0043797803 /DNA_START=120 /DNA_END=887 /DNA_ORIENTATION=+